MTVEAIHYSEIFVDVWPHIVAEGLEAVGPFASIVGAPLSVIANLMEIAEAHEVGDRSASRFSQSTKPKILPCFVSPNQHKICIPASETSHPSLVFASLRRFPKLIQRRQSRKGLRDFIRS